MSDLFPIISASKPPTNSLPFQLASVRHSRVAFPIDPERLPVPLCRRPATRLLLLSIRRHALLFVVAGGWTATGEAVLPGALGEVGSADRGTQGESLQLHVVPAHDANLAQLVYQSGRTRNRCAPSSVCFGNVLWSSATIGNCDPGGKNATHDDQFE